MAANGFAPSTTQQAVATQNAQSVAITATTPPTLRIINLGPKTVYVALGTTQPVTVTPTTGLAIEPGGPPEFLSVGSNAFIGIVADTASFAKLNLTQGT